jgi:hypothetical protein
VVVDAVSFITTGVPKAVHERERFFILLRDRLSESGWAATVRPADASCGTGRECLARTQEQTGADYVVRVSGEGNLLRGYTLHLQVYSPVTRHVQRAATFCDLCATDRIAGIAAEFAIALVTDTVKEEQAARLESGQRETPSPPQPHPLAPPLTGASSATVPVPSAELVALPRGPTGLAWPSWVPWLSWSLVGAGAVGAAYGGWALYENGRYTGAPRVDANQTLVRDRYASGAVGATALAVGAGLAVVGALLRISEPSPRPGPGPAAASKTATLP